MTIRVLIVEPGEVYRQALTELIEERGAGMVLAGQAATPAAALETARGTGPMVMLVGGRRADDHNWIGMITKADPTVLVVVLATKEDPASVVASIRAGARGYLPMSCHEDEILAAIRTVAEGGTAFHPSLTAEALLYSAHAGQDREGAPPGQGSALELLTIREREILGFLAEGRTPSEIANTLFISRRTVETHLANAYHKLGVHGRIDAIRRLRLDGSPAM